MFVDLLLLLLALAFLFAGAFALFALLTRHAAARAAGPFPGRKP